MLSGGLSRTDTERQEHVIGGLARAFFERVGRHYGERLAWRFEPNVAEAVLTDWLAEAGVDVRFRAPLRELGKNGRRISGGRFGRHAVAARTWIDATYEGDLLAAAGVSYRIGRESRELHGESLAGRRELLPGPHQFRAAVSARDDDGRLLPYVQRLERIGQVGEGDGKLQSYCYRICLTSDPDKRLPHEAPPDYDRNTYALVQRYLDALGDSATLRDFMGMGQLPNHKFDVNSDGPVSTNLLGGSWGYPEANPARRASIRRQHRRWAQGLLYFLATDAGVPKSIRDRMAAHGLPRDEFVDTEHWPHQLYVREARRMVGAYFLTQHDLQERRTKPDAIGMAGYNIDVREVQWVAAPVSRFPDVFDEVLTEGYLSWPVEAWQIPYRSLTPVRAECSNLLVPVCISASQIAFASFRMKPQFMIAGEAAGTAAALAARRGGAVQDVDLGELQNRLRSDGQILSLPRT